MDKYICIHGHFYQPPRENPWLEDVELQDGAYPYHDWNQRITEECYRQNAASRILGDDRKIVNIVNNYATMSFNFGPTLLSWLQTKAPDVYQKILDADKLSIARYSGHGSALAQPYNHMIMPLCNAQDKHTQIIWGIRDFEVRFGRKPEGMWLPETAVNTDSLEALAEHGIRFTVLSPRQAQKVRKIGKRWKDVNEETLDTTVPYVCHLPSGKKIVLFFYCGPVSHDVAYGGLLHSGENFAGRILKSFPESDGAARLVHLATDGESFGHHHRHGDMALAYCLHQIETRSDAKLTIYGEFLEKFPPENEAMIHENSSWSCAHGVERWKSNCGCCSDQSLVGKQDWRAPLRETLDWLRDWLAAVFDERMRAFVQDPWAIRNAYIEIVLDRSKENVQRRLREWMGRELEPHETCTVLKLLEMQRNTMLMYTSCGWFFDDVSGLETTQIMQYAARAIQLCRDVVGLDLEPEFADRLEQAPSHKGLHPNGKAIYEALIKPMKVDLERVGAHIALSSLFQEGDVESTDIFTYSAAITHFQRQQAGIQVLTTGTATIHSNIICEKKTFYLVGLYLGGQNLFATLGSHLSEGAMERSEKLLIDAFQKGDTNEVMRLMNVLFDGDNYSISHLFRDEQRRILDELLENTWQEIESAFRHIYEHNYSIMQLMHNMNIPLPAALSAPAEFVLNRDLTRSIRKPEINVRQIKRRFEEVRRFGLTLNRRRIQFEFNRKIAQMFVSLEEKPEDTALLGQIEELLEIVKTMDTDLNLQNAQNIFFTIAKTIYPSARKKADAGDEAAQKWIRHLGNLAQLLDLVIV